MTCLRGNVADGCVQYDISCPLLLVFAYIVLVARCAPVFVIQATERVYIGPVEFHLPIPKSRQELTSWTGRDETLWHEREIACSTVGPAAVVLTFVTVHTSEAARRRLVLFFTAVRIRGLKDFGIKIFRSSKNEKTAAWTWNDGSHGYTSGQRKRYNSAGANTIMNTHTVLRTSVAGAGRHSSPMDNTAFLSNAAMGMDLCNGQTFVR